MISQLKSIIKHFSRSTISANHLREEQRGDSKDEAIHGLQKIGKTRFGTHWSAAVSLEQNLPAIRALVERKIVKFKVGM